MAKYWVGGATGFLGSHLTRALLDDGHQVVLASRGGGTVHGHAVECVDVHDAARVQASAKGTDGAFLATGMVSRDPAAAEALYAANALATRSALAGLRAAKVPRVVYASTSGTIAVSAHDEVFDETADAPLELLAKWPYYRSKYYGEREALEANEPGTFDVVVVNPSLLLGPGDLRGSSTGDIRQFLEGEILAVPRGGLALVDVRDAARAMANAMTRGRAGARYLLNAGNLPFESFFRRLSQISGVPAPRLPLPRSGAVAASATRLFARALATVGGTLPMDSASVEMATHYWYCDSTLAVNELGFAPRDVADTLRDTVDDLVLRGVAYPRTGRIFSAASHDT
jgi:dihydroflavonol-4-reductase